MIGSVRDRQFRKELVRGQGEARKVQPALLLESWNEMPPLPEGEPPERRSRDERSRRAGPQEKFPTADLPGRIDLLGAFHEDDWLM